MDVERLLAARLSSQLLLDQAENVVQATGHMLALQSQDFAAGRYALALRAGDQATRVEIDQLFSDGHLVRSWTMRGTLHICLPQDVRWLVRASRVRTLRKQEPRLRELQIDPATIERSTALVASYLEEQGQASRTAIFQQLNEHGIKTRGQRGVHILMVLVQHGLICLGPIPVDAKLVAQDYVMLDHWVSAHHEPEDSLAELLRRYLNSHGPAIMRDAAWYTGLTLTSMRDAADRLGELLISVGADSRDEHYWVINGSRAHRSLESTGAEDLPLRLLGAFDEYLLSYADRSLAADQSMLKLIMPGTNGMFLPFWLENGTAQKAWNAKAAPTDLLGAALHQRYVDFQTAH